MRVYSCSTLPVVFSQEENQNIILKLKNRIGLSKIFVCLIAIIFSIPLISVFILSFTPSSEEIWQHLFETVLFDYVSNTIFLMLGVGFFATFIGVSTAWFVSSFYFPAKKYFEWALLLPLAIPAYIIGNVYVELLEYAGPFQKVVREIFGWSTAKEYWFPEIRSLGGAITMMSFVLYPYIYLLTRAALLNQSSYLLDASLSLGKNRFQTFFQITLPLARPFIVLGISLVCMETIADFGTVDLFGVDTITRGIYNVWLGMYNPHGAAQLSLTLLGFVILLLCLEQLSRKRKECYRTKDTQKKHSLIHIPKIGQWGLSIFCFIPIFCGFLLPLYFLIKWSFQEYSQRYYDSFLTDIFHSISLASLASLGCLLIAIFLAYMNRFYWKPSIYLLTRISCIGYAIPGSIIALGVFIPLAAFDNTLDAWMRSTFGISTGLLLTGSIFAIVFGYMIRFMTVSFGSIESGLEKIKCNMEYASRSLGKNQFQTLQKVHTPLLRKSMMASLILVFVDSIKELPATLMLQPFNFSNLATRIYQYASDERLQEAAPWCLAIVLVGMLPVVVLSHSINHPKH